MVLADYPFFRASHPAPHSLLVLFARATVPVSSTELAPPPGGLWARCSSRRVEGARCSPVCFDAPCLCLTPMTDSIQRGTSSGALAASAGAASVVWRAACCGCVTCMYHFAIPGWWPLAELTEVNRKKVKGDHENRKPSENQQCQEQVTASPRPALWLPQPWAVPPPTAAARRSPALPPNQCVSAPAPGRSGALRQ